MKPGAWRTLALVMGAGALYDLAFGVSIVFFPRASSEMLRIPLPADTFHLTLNGVFLMILGAIYLLPARRPERYHPIAPIAAAGRVGGFALFALAWRGGRETVFIVLGIGDLFLAVLTLAAWAAARRAPPSA